MTEIDDTRKRACRWWQWVRVAGMAAVIAVNSPILFFGPSTIFVGGFVIRWLWALRA